jgi:hypothetical protein
MVVFDAVVRLLCAGVVELVTAARGTCGPAKLAALEEGIRI